MKSCSTVKIPTELGDESSAIRTKNPEEVTATMFQQTKRKRI